MNKRRWVHAVTLLVGFGLGAVAVLAAKPPETPLDFKGSNKEVADRILTRAETLAGSGSWERIAVGRVKYLSGDKAAGEALFNAVRNGKPEASDYMRIGAVYALAKEWDKASAMFDEALKLKPAKTGFLCESGAWYNLNGKRDKAEELFNRAQAKDPSDFWDHVVMAASYLDQAPF